MARSQVGVNDKKVLKASSKTKQLAVDSEKKEKVVTKSTNNSKKKVKSNTTKNENMKKVSTTKKIQKKNHAHNTDSNAKTNLKSSTSSSIKKSPKDKKKEKAVQKSRQANAKRSEKVVSKEEKQSKKKVKSTNTGNPRKKAKKKTAIYISPSQLEKQNKKKFPWEIIVILIILACFFGGMGVYTKIFGDNSLVSRTNSYDTLNEIASDKTDIISVGSSNFKYSKSNPYSVTLKAKIVKTNQSGKILFEKVYDSKKTSVFNSVAVTSDGYVASGSMVEDGDLDKQVGLLVKYDKDGNLLWEKTYELAGNTQFLKLKVVDDGYLVVGSSLLTEKTEEEIEAGALIAKYDSTGNLIWQKFYGDSGKAKFNALVIENQKIYAVGKNESDFGVLSCYTMDGNFEWDKIYSYTDDQGFTDILAKDQMLYVVGSKKILPNAEDNEERNTTNTDALLLKYNLSGDIQLEKVFGGSNQERYTALSSYGKYIYAVGFSNSTDSGLKIFTDGKKKTGILVKYDISGSVERKTVFGGSNDDVITDILTDNSNIYMTALTNSKDGNIMIGTDNGKDSFGKLVKVDSRFRPLFVISN